MHPVHTHHDADMDAVLTHADMPRRRQSQTQSQTQSYSLSTPHLRWCRYKTIALPDVGTKMIAAVNRNQVDHDASGMEAGSGVMAMPDGSPIIFGSIDLHGRPRIRSWTKV